VSEMDEILAQARAKKEALREERDEVDRALARGRLLLGTVISICMACISGAVWVTKLQGRAAELERLVGERGIRLDKIESKESAFEAYIVANNISILNLTNRINANEELVKLLRVDWLKDHERTEKMWWQRMQGKTNRDIKGEGFVDEP